MSEKRKRFVHSSNWARWNPKNLDAVKSPNGPHATEVWLYLTGRQLDVVVQVSHKGVVLGQTVHKVRLPLRMPQ